MTSSYAFMSGSGIQWPGCAAESQAEDLGLMFTRGYWSDCQMLYGANVFSTT
ncbi:hypothetical protein KC19_10G117100 [Ceratodon purpureus]|uniref:Uncharacterized protein n=1 Tax=Ceratodon purpureus TaxID=3225 RepID=A0A8T0GJ94_CERPU|nr:hypothetical protein KC19_10G117100 [Ceratodon purpureus]